MKTSGVRSYCYYCQANTHSFIEGKESGDCVVCNISKTNHSQDSEVRMKAVLLVEDDQTEALIEAIADRVASKSTPKEPSDMNDLLSRCIEAISPHATPENIVHTVSPRCYCAHCKNQALLRELRGALGEA